MVKNKSWIEIAEDADFSMFNFPFGIFETQERSPRVGSALGNYVIDLSVLEEAGYFKSFGPDLAKCLTSSYLNDFISLGKSVTKAVREELMRLFREDNPELKEREQVRKAALISMDEVRMKMPVKVGDYTDFYSSEGHATNVGKMFRSAENALLPNWKHLPVGYHGRASSIIPSGTPIKRPKGQILKTGDQKPVFQATEKLDFELELAFITGSATELGSSISILEATENIFGFVLFNDWSARDIQKWEYVPLGPFLAKSFASSISPWVVTLEALLPFRVEGPVQIPEVLAYLRQDELRNFDINMEVAIKPVGNQGEKTVTRTNFRNMYWSIEQQLTHQTINGCNINVGDMYASGTVSGFEEGSYGSMLELTWNGKNPVQMPDGTSRAFIEDGDTVIMRAFARKDGIRVGFGEVSTLVLPSQ